MEWRRTFSRLSPWASERSTPSERPRLTSIHGRKAASCQNGPAGTCGDTAVPNGLLKKRWHLEPYPEPHELSARPKERVGRRTMR